MSNGCSSYLLYFSAASAVSATYRNCGDNTPFTVYMTGGSPGTSATQVIASNYPVPIKVYTGSVSAGTITVPGFVYPWVVVPWADFTLTNTVTGISGVNGFPYPTT